MAPITNNIAKTGSINKWWATAGSADILDKPVVWTVTVEEPGRYTLAIESGSQWKLNDDASVTSTELIDLKEKPFINGKVNFDIPEPGTYNLQISGFQIPKEPVVENISFSLNIFTASAGASPVPFPQFFVETNKLDALFIADHTDLYNKPYSITDTNGETKDITEYTERSPTEDIPDANGERKDISVEELIDRFAPVLYFDAGITQNTNDDERYAVAVDVNKTWGNDDVWQDTNIQPRTITGDSNYSLDFSSFETKRFTPSTTGAVYASFLENGNGEIAINYYFHYPRSNWKTPYQGQNDHEGDWEGITVFLDSTLTPKEVAFSQHIEFGGVGGGVTIPWKFVEHDEQDSNRPKVYVGLGGHASYPFPGITKWVTPSGIKQEFHKGDLSVFKPTSDQVQYLPRAGSLDLNNINNINSEKNWLLYPGTWGSPDLDNDGSPFDSDAAPRGPFFLDIDLNLSPTSGSGAGERWLNPWEWSSNFRKTVTSLGLSAGLESVPIQGILEEEDSALIRNSPVLIGNDNGETWGVYSYRDPADSLTFGVVSENLTISGGAGNDAYRITTDENGNSNRTIFISDRGGINDILEIKEPTDKGISRISSAPRSLFYTIPDNLKYLERLPGELSIEYPLAFGLPFRTSADKANGKRVVPDVIYVLGSNLVSLEKPSSSESIVETIPVKAMGFEKVGSTLVIDLNRNGVAELVEGQYEGGGSDLAIINFFDEFGTGPGSGFIEKFYTEETNSKKPEDVFEKVILGQDILDFFNEPSEEPNNPSNSTPLPPQDTANYVPTDLNTIEELTSFSGGFTSEGVVLFPNETDLNRSGELIPSTLNFDSNFTNFL